MRTGLPTRSHWRSPRALPLARCRAGTFRRWHSGSIGESHRCDRLIECSRAMTSSPSTSSLTIAAALCDSRESSLQPAPILRNLHIDECVYRYAIHRVAMATMNLSIKRGSAELAVLAVLEQQPLHGYEIARRIEQQSDGALRFTLASLYPLLYRMEKRGWTKATWETTPAGVRRRCYGLTAKGVRQLGATRREWDAFFHALSRIGGLRGA